MSTLDQVILEGTDASKPTPSIPGRLYLTTDTNLIYRDTGTAWQAVGPSGGSTEGTVTSVGLAVPSRQGVTGSPITGSGMITITDNAQAANTFFRGPNSGSSAVPTFGPLVVGDLPESVLTNPMTTEGDLIVGGADGAPTRLGIGASGQVLTSNGSGAEPSWQTPGSDSSSMDILSDQKATGTLYSNKAEYLGVSPGQTITLLSRPSSESGYVSSILLALENQTNAQTATINIYVNGDTTPNVSMSLENFFESVYISGSAAPNSCFGNFAVGCNSSSSTANSMYSLLPIPYANGITITLTLPDADTIFYTVSGQAGVSDTWPNTRKFWANGSYLAAPTANSTETFLNYVGSNPGRYLGLWMLSDGYPNTLSPYGADLEGNFRIYLDCFDFVWSAGATPSVGATMIDPNGNLQTATTVTGPTGSSAPTNYGIVTGATMADGGVTWTCTAGDPPNIHRVSAVYTVGMSFLDPNGNVQTCTTTGTSSATAPATWGSTQGATTADGSVTWTCSIGSTRCKAAYQSSGTEDYFLLGFYGGGVPAGFSNAGIVGRTFVGANPQTTSFYRFHVRDPITFQRAIAVLKQTGDTSEINFSGTPRVWATAYWYTQDTD